MSRVIVVKAVFDPEARVWLTESGDVYGLRIEAASIEELMDRIPGAIRDLLEGNGDYEDAVDIPVEIIASASTKVRLGCAA